MKTKLFDNPYKEKPHAMDKNGVHKIYRFPNGYGASVVRFKIGEYYGSYTSNENEWELAVIEWNDRKQWITYDTWITDDVLGHLSKFDVEKTLRTIKDLPKKEKLKI